MYISKIHIANYKSFSNSDQLEFDPDFNIIVGQNNSGKTALLEALSLNFSNIEHRSTKTLPLPSSKPKTGSKIKVTLNFRKDEFNSFFDQLEPNTIGIQLQKNTNFKNEDIYELFQQWMNKLESGELSFVLLAERDSIEESFQIKDLTPPLILSHIISYRSIPAFDDDPPGLYLIQKNDNGNFYFLPPEKRNFYDVEKFKSFNKQFFYYLTKDIYLLNAERSYLGSCGFGSNSRLKPDASNLAEVLNILKNRENKECFHTYNNYLSTIFPNIREVDVTPKDDSNSHLEVRIWSKEASQNNRKDFSLPLSACGTGIGQVLAILYVVITSPKARTIIIDEPQSFLHPGAAKKLIQVLKEFPKHQYFIATHSPQIVAVANPSNIIHLQYEDSETKTKVISSSDMSQMRSFLYDIGVSLSDIFGADNILWVEGATEELCFKQVWDKLVKKPLNSQIIGIKNTGDLEGKHSATIFEIYRRLSGGNTLFPPAIGFLLDRELREEKHKADFMRAANEFTNEKKGEKPLKVKFLTKRMYENYLLHPKAIATVLNSIFDEHETLRNKIITETDIQNYIEKKKNSGVYIPNKTKKESLSYDEWLSDVSGAKVLEDIFNKFSEGSVEFKKTKHSYLITEWLIENDPKHLSEIKEILEDMLNCKPEAK